MEWKSRRRDVPERLEPSLSDAASAEEEGLDRLCSITKYLAYRVALCEKFCKFAIILVE